MPTSPSPAAGYTCPMHPDVRQAEPGTCPKCKMALVKQGDPFGFIRHVTGNPRMRLIMGILMAAIMFGVMWKLFM